ncbi:MAG: hypothetical protein EOO64_01695 [Massilia sp.]|nr:MAG: hypothetical protein EOO64_01695 [Massilia sp.]
MKITTIVESPEHGAHAAFYRVSRVEASGAELILTAGDSEGMVPVGKHGDERQAHSAAYAAASIWLGNYLEALRR